MEKREQLARRNKRRRKTKEQVEDQEASKQGRERGLFWRERRGVVLEQATREGSGDLFPHYLSSRGCCSLPCVKTRESLRGNRERERRRGRGRRKKKEGCFPLAQPDPRVRKRGELCFLCPNQTRNKREGKEKRKEKEREGWGERESCDFREKLELEREGGCFRRRIVAFSDDMQQWCFRRTRYSNSVSFHA